MIQNCEKQIIYVYITLKFKITYKLGRMIAFQQNHMKVCFYYYFYLLNALVA